MDGIKTPESKLDPGVQFGFQTESIGVGADHFTTTDGVDRDPDLSVDGVLEEPDRTVAQQSIDTTWVTAASSSIAAAVASTTCTRQSWRLVHAEHGLIELVSKSAGCIRIDRFIRCHSAFEVTSAWHALPDGSTNVVLVALNNFSHHHAIGSSIGESCDTDVTHVAECGLQVGHSVSVDRNVGLVPLGIAPCCNIVAL